MTTTLGTAPTRDVGDNRGAHLLIARTIHNATALRLGPEPLIGAQRIELFSKLAPQHSLWVVTDGLRPFAVIGDDEASRAWLQRRGAALRERGAVGLVVLARLRQLRPALPVLVLSSSEEPDDVRRALYASKIIAYAQGFNQIQAGSAENNWGITPGVLATIYATMTAARMALRWIRGG